jgi:hypothetical protein
MINYCLINTKKLLQFKFNPIEEEEEEERFYADELHVRVVENGEQVFYSFADYDSLDMFLMMLDMEDVDYDVVDEDGNVIELDEDYDDDEY